MPPQLKVIKPSVMKGSNGTCPTRLSISETASACAPASMLPKLVPTDEPSCMRLRFLRSLKNAFQVSLSAGEGEGCAVEAVLAVEAVVDAYLTIWEVDFEGDFLDVMSRGRLVCGCCDWFFDGMVV